MIYLNNAGTSWPKPEEVNRTIAEFGSINPNEWTAAFDKAIERVKSFFNMPNGDNFLFTTSCTSALAIALSDFPWQSNDRLIISSMEHHGLSRYFYKLQYERSVQGVIIPRSENGPFDLAVFEEELKKGARMVAISMACNVTGEILPYQEISDLCKEYEVFCLMDGAQVAGILDIDIQSIDPDFFAFGGHKGPQSLQGIGGLYIKERTPMACPSAICEVDEEESKLSYFPSYCDVGSVNMAGVLSLTSGLNWITRQGIEELLFFRRKLITKLTEGCNKIDHLEIMGSDMIEKRVGALALISNVFTPQQLATELNAKGGIIASAGFQCSPMAHEAIGTSDHGVLRISVGPFNTEEEIDVVLQILFDMKVE